MSENRSFMFMRKKTPTCFLKGNRRGWCSYVYNTPDTLQSVTQPKEKKIGAKQFAWTWRCICITRPGPTNLLWFIRYILKSQVKSDQIAIPNVIRISLQTPHRACVLTAHSAPLRAAFKLLLPVRCNTCNQMLWEKRATPLMVPSRYTLIFWSPDLSQTHRQYVCP